MKKSTKVIIVSISVLALGGLGYCIYLKHKNKKRLSLSPQYIRQPAISMDNDELKYVYEEICAESDVWKVKEALNEGLLIQPEWGRPPKYDNLSYCEILGWMYHIKYESSWGKDKNGKNLYESALYQAHEQKKKKIGV